MKAKIKNRKIYSDDQEYLIRLREDYSYIGYDTSLEDGELTVYAIPRKKLKEVRERTEAGKEARNKRAEKHSDA